ncbi:MAG: rRNA maturation RNase YbeY [Gemmatimonadetes bacterium]|nr:rRNA maturation RNase YbeY [Gemmatimonadota bacterium]
MSAASRGDPLRVGVARDGVRSAVSAERLADAARAVLRAEGVRAALLSVTLVSSAAIARMNRRHLRHAGPTDVISFGLSAMPGTGVVGDIYLCPEVARENARTAGCSVREELLRLVVHGTLHVLGWDHPEGPARERSPMWRRQERLLAAVLRRQA